MADMFRFLTTDPFHEMHLIAYYYHWDRNTLLNLPPRERKRWVEFIIEHVQMENNAKEV